MKIMKPILQLLHTLVFAALAVFNRPAVAAPGDVEAGFNSNVGGSVLSTAMQADGKILIGGGFTIVEGLARAHIARLNADGTLDTAFNASVDDNVRSIAVQDDSKILIGGDFTTADGVARNRIARLNADGTLDTGFDPGASNDVYSMAVQEDGKIVMGGLFTNVAGAGRNRIARLNADGTLDTAFDPNANGVVRTTAVQVDGKIVIGGQFGAVGGAVRAYVARLNVDGTLDTAFNPSPNGSVNSVAVQADGKIVIAGEFAAVGAEAISFVARLNADGTPETDFKPAPNSQVRSTVLQVDGRIIIGGDFTAIGTVGRNRISRLTGAGALDTDFNPIANNNVYSLALQADGKVLCAGIFTSVGGMSRSRLARLDNDEATHSLTVPTVSRVEWKRGGSSPDTLRVAFDLTTDGGTTWNTLGSGTRITGGWELTGQSLPAGGQVRARARTAGGQYNGSAGNVAEVQAFAFEPEIAVVEEPVGTVLEDGTASVSFGAVLTGAFSTRRFKITNTGLHALTGLDITFDGLSQSDYSVSVSPAAPVAAGTGSTTFTVRFAPTTAGEKKEATLHLASNDVDENPFDIALTASALDSNADNDGDGVTNAAEVNMAALGFNPLADNAFLVTLLKANGFYRASDMQTLALGSPVLEKDAATGNFHLSLGVLKSPDLSTWLPVPGTVNFDIAPDGPAPQFYRVLGKKP